MALALIAITVYALPCAAQSCPEQLDDQKRKTLTLSLQIDKFKENETLYEKRQALSLDVEKLHLKQIDITDSVAQKWKKMYEDAEMRTQRHWYEHPALWVTVGVVLTLGAIGGGFGIARAMQQPSAQ